MAKAYWVVTYRKIKDPEKLTAYAKLAGPAIQSMGGKFIVRGTPAKTFEAGLNERTVVSEWPDLKAAIAAYESPAYKEALRALAGGVERDIRIVEGAA
jgi:uncharacterized protein (DUF1330 family)